MFGSLENERKRREKREKQTLKLKAAGDIYINEKLPKDCLGLQNGGGGGGWVGEAYIGHPMCETTRKPNILAHTRDKEVIHQNRVVWH